MKRGHSSKLQISKSQVSMTLIFRVTSLVAVTIAAVVFMRSQPDTGQAFAVSVDDETYAVTCFAQSGTPPSQEHANLAFQVFDEKLALLNGWAAREMTVAMEMSNASETVAALERIEQQRTVFTRNLTSNTHCEFGCDVSDTRHIPY
ncbi:hypothetical protein SLH49_02250 [Cognatiyoonia sp. IB215446]|uniref:hypothetical protein n=1 Tax=Cognatiyoonia sp. IB215446 TaxID=3097355 RepID=UPI002A16838F|nr:hypothetical protein [Cognatiyoonia sp. IB215446]MDX8346796.1 hypothetical protein [Cognatiyoonia sp. IB215446]